MALNAPGPGLAEACRAMTQFLLLSLAALVAAEPSRTTSKPESSSDAAALIKVNGQPGDGLSVAVGEAFSLNLRSRIQLRYQLAISAEDAADERALQQLVNIGTARLWLSGHIYSPTLTYMIQLALAGRDFRDGATSPIYDAFFDWKLHRDFNLRAGQYFVPFDRLRTVREWALQMSDRPRPVLEMTLDRDVGVTVYSNSFLGSRSPVAWRLSAFGGGGTNLSNAREPGGLFVGRVELRPLGPLDDDVEGDLERRADPKLAVGAAYAVNLNTNRLRSTTGPTFKGGTTDHQHAAVDFVLKWQGAMLQAEWLWKRASADEIVFMDALNAQQIERTRSGQGAVVQGSYLFSRPLELVARASRLWAAPGTDPTYVLETAERGDELAAGANFYVNGHKLKFQATWIARMPKGFVFEHAEHLAVAQLDATM
jgi:hypothetical protein